MEQQFIAVTEKAPRLEKLETEPVQKFLVLYDSYVHRNILGGATVPMASCLEKEDLLELLEETVDDVLTGEARPVLDKSSGGVKGALAAEEAPEGGEGSVGTEKRGSLISDDYSSDEEEGQGVRAPRLKRYVRLSTEHVKAMLVKHLGPVTSDASLAILQKIRMTRDEVPFSKNRCFDLPEGVESGLGVVRKTSAQREIDDQGFHQRSLSK
jgi:hypothetical protein